jgi:hypothetical protein
LLQQSHLDPFIYSGTDNYVDVVFENPQKRTLMVEAFSHAAPNFQVLSWANDSGMVFHLAGRVNTRKVEASSLTECGVVLFGE